MEDKKQGTVIHNFDKCACCLEDGALKDMWGQYINNGEVEIYGEMLRECLSLSLDQLTEYAEQICDKCIERLRYSLAFRREALASKEVLEQLKEGMLESGGSGEMEVKIEVEEFSLDQQDITIDIPVEGKNFMVSEDSQLVEYLSYSNNSDRDENLDSSEMVTEYLEEDVAEPAKPKKSRHTYKRYSRSDLSHAMKAVFKDHLPVIDAAAKYNIPVKTLRAKVKKRETKEDDTATCTELDESKKNQDEFYNEIRTVLTYTNATPYKTKVGRFYCAYCSTQGPRFLDVHALRTHTRTEHAVERINNVDMIMRPSYLNEVLKLDIYKLQCTVCMTDISEWNEMFDHLKEAHNVDLEQAYTRIIPFVLDYDCQCALCDKSFSHYHLLDVHMNAHYNNYICGECGDTFLSETRLKKHAEIHSTGKFPCQDCGKEFSLEKYRKKHYDFVHLKEHKFKCAFCDEIFNSAYARHQHMEKDHSETIKTFECQHCQMTFTWRPYYLKHIRLNHSTKYQCKLCSKRFRQRHEIKNHLEWHKGTGYTCKECGKKFSSKNYLQKHTASCKEVIVFQVS